MAKPVAHNGLDVGSTPAAPTILEQAIEEYGLAFERYWLHRHNGFPFWWWKRRRYLEKLNLLRLDKERLALKVAYWDLERKSQLTTA